MARKGHNHGAPNKFRMTRSALLSNTLTGTERTKRLLQNKIFKPHNTFTFDRSWNDLGTVVDRSMAVLSLWPASVAQVDAPSDWRPGGRGFNPRRCRQHSFVGIDHEIFSTVILSLPLIQKGQLSVSGKIMCTILVNRLED